MIWPIIALPWLALLAMVLWDSGLKDRPWWFKEEMAIDRFTGWLGVWTALLFIATVVSAVMLYLTDRTLHNQLEIALQSSTKAERGLLITEGWDVQRFGAGLSPVISFKLKNTGRSPNYILAGGYEFAISADFPPIFSGSRKDIPQLPGIIRQTTESQIKVAELPIIKETDFSLLEKRQEFLFLRITIRYRDISGSQYELVSTAKCARMGGESLFEFEFPEESVPKAQWAMDAGEFAKTRRYNGHRQIGKDD